MDMRTSPRYYPTHPILAAVLEGDFPIAQALVTNISVSGARLVTDVAIGRGIYVKLSLWTRNKLFLRTDALVLWSSAATTAAGDTSQGVLFTRRSASFRKRMEKVLVPPAFMDVNLASTGPSRETGGTENELLRDFELLSSRLRKD